MYKSTEKMWIRSELFRVFEFVDELLFFVHR